MKNSNNLPYNHLDPAEKQIPLSVKLADLTSIKLDHSILSSKKISIRSGSGRIVIINLLTDSKHLELFFTENWKPVDDNLPADAEIIALKKNMEFYNLPVSLNGSRWFCKTSRRVLIPDSEFYGNLKITVRGICSEIALENEMFVHGCALSIHNRGIILSGMSGAGKTTLTSYLRSKFKIKIINDDWGGLDLKTGQISFTGEPNLHMKYPSVKSLAPHIKISPETHYSENYLNDDFDPKARLLIKPEEVFSSENLRKTENLSFFLIITRFEDEPASLKEVSPKDLSIFEKEQYSAFYKRSEQFLNGSLFLCDNDQIQRERDLHKFLVQNYRCFVFNNSGEIERTAGLFINKILA